MLEIKNLSYNVVEDKNNKDILENVNLKFDNNKIYVITGPNGSGKSTLVKLIMGLLTPSSGQIFFDGKDITALSIDTRARLGISYAFQQPVTFKGLKVRDLLDVASGKKNRNALGFMAAPSESRRSHQRQGVVTYKGIRNDSLDVLKTATVP